MIKIYCALKFNLTGDADYTSGPYDVTFRKGEQKKYFSIPILDDKLYEGKEDFNVAIHELPHGIVRAYPYAATIEIRDDECK